MRSLKVAFLTEFFHPHVGGCERRYLEIGRHLVSRGHDVHIFTIQYSYSLPKEEQNEGIKIHRYAYSRDYIASNSFRSFRGILKYSAKTFMRLLGSNFDLYYANQWPMLHSLFAKPISSPLIQEWCEVWTNVTRVVLMQRLLKSVGDYHVAVSEFTKQRLSNYLKIPSEKIVMIPNGVDFNRFSSSKKKVWGRIIYAGRIVPHKNVELLVDVFREIKKKVPEAELHIVGSGLSLQSVKKRATGIRDCFVHGFLAEDKMIDLIKSAWLFVLPSKREGSGIVALEAMAAGVPFITLNYPDNATKEFCRFKCGIVVEPLKSSISKTVISLFNDKELWKELSTNATDFAKKHDWSMITNQIEDFFDMVVRNSEK